MHAQLMILLAGVYGFVNTIAGMIWIKTSINGTELLFISSSILIVLEIYF
jgi:hypothetical protein